MRAVLIYLAGFLLCCAGCASEVLKGKVETAQKEEAAVRTQLAQAQEQLAAVGAENQRLTSELASDRKIQSQTAERMTLLTGQIGELTRRHESQQEALTAENQRLTEELRQSKEQIAFQDASLSRTPTEVIIPNRGERFSEIHLDGLGLLPPRYEGDFLIVELQDRLLFDAADGKLTQEGKNRLAHVADQMLKVKPTGRIRVESHTAGRIVNQDSASNGKTGSHAEAYTKGKAVFDFLIEQQQISPGQIALTLWGNAAPLIPENIPNAELRNSRIELILE